MNTAFPFRSYPASKRLVPSCRCAGGVPPVHNRFPCSGPVPSLANWMITLLSGVSISLCKQPLFGPFTDPVQLVVYTGPLLFVTKLYTNTFSELDPLVSPPTRSEEHTSELQSHHDLVCRLLLEKKKKQINHDHDDTVLYTLHHIVGANRRS